MTCALVGVTLLVTLAGCAQPARSCTDVASLVMHAFGRLDAAPDAPAEG